MATVSNALRGVKATSADVKCRVRDAVQSLGYAPDRAASQICSGRNRGVAVSVRSFDNPLFTELIAALERCARAAGFDVVIASAGGDDDTERHHLGALLAWRPAGMIVLPRTDMFVARDALPRVIVDRLADLPHADLIAVDNRGAGAEAVRHLAALGHCRLLVVATSRALANIRARWDSARGAARVLGLRAPQVLDIGVSFGRTTTALGARRSALGSAGIRRRPASSHSPTSPPKAVLACLREHGLDVPDDGSLAGFDDCAWMRAVSPPVTAIRQPVERLGEEAWSRLVERMAGGGATPVSPARWR